MADTRGRIGSGGVFLRKHAVEPSSKVALFCYYRLTSTGSKVLAEEAARLHANATAALQRLRPGFAGGVA
jgi:hypothetical protein